MQRLQREAENRSQGLPGSLAQGQSKRQDDDLALHAVNYHLDELEISIPGPVGLYAVPPRQLAENFLLDYLRTVHRSSLSSADLSSPHNIGISSITTHILVINGLRF